MEGLQSTTSEPQQAALLDVSTLRRDAGCARLLNWRCDVPLDLDPEAFEEGLIAVGWSSRCRHPALRVLRHPDGHELAWVLASGRIQIRVAIFIEATRREEISRGLYEDVLAAYESVSRDVNHQGFRVGAKSASHDFDASATSSEESELGRMR